MTLRPIKLDHWAREIIVDPLSKEPLTFNEDETFLVSPYGRKYPITDGVLDLRLLNNEITADQKLWKEGQRRYESLAVRLAAQDPSSDYCQEIEGLREVYEDIPVQGPCLDVGGHQGRLRQFISPDQPYITCDTFLNVFDDLANRPNLIKAYPFLLKPVNFVCCDAEFLPFRSTFFQTVHMRSVIDHFLSPELALNEAYRVMEPEGSLIVGLYVLGGKSGKPNINYVIKQRIKEALVAVGMTSFRDWHVWHPSYAELTDLIFKCGFNIEKTHWQKGYNDTVCYISARKRLGITRVA